MKAAPPSDLLQLDGLSKLSGHTGYGRCQRSHGIILCILAICKKQVSFIKMRMIVCILAKGRALFPELTPLISTGGKDSDRRRVMKICRMAALMEHNGIPAVANRKNSETPYFIPSACWRRIASGILSTPASLGCWWQVHSGWRYMTSETENGMAGTVGGLVVLHPIWQL